MTPRHVFDAVGDAVYAVGHFGTVPLAKQAAAMGMTENQFRDAINPERKPRYAADWVAPQTRAAHDFAIIRTLAQLCGGYFIPLPSLASGDNADVLAALGDAFREIAEDAAVITTALEDGQIDAREAQRAGEEIDQSIEKLLALKALVRQKARLHTATATATVTPSLAHLGGAR